MKKYYEDPLFEITRFSFEKILTDGYMDQSIPEETHDVDGGEFPNE